MNVKDIGGVLTGFASPLTQARLAFDANYVQGVADAVALPLDQFKVMLVILSGYPLALVHRSLPNATAKHIYSIFWGVLGGFFVIGWDMLHSFITATLVYAIMARARRGSAHHRVVFTLVFVYMCFSHLYRQYTSYLKWEMDMTGPQMILTVKMIAFAYNVADGLAPREATTPDQRERAVTQYPSLLEYYSFVYYYGGFISGPTFEFAEYRAFSDNSLFRDAPGKRAPASLLPGLERMAYGFILAAVMMFSPAFQLQTLATEEYINSHGFLERYAWMLWATYLFRFKYYAAWLIAEGQVIVAGLGYNGPDPKKPGSYRWDRVRNVQPLRCETAVNVRELMQNWNMGVQRWLRDYVYMRQVKPDGRPLWYANIMTYMVSAMWHGFYPGYYLTFFFGGLQNEVARHLRRHLRPMFLRDDGAPGTWKPVYDVAGQIATALGITTVGMPFVVLSWEQSYKVMRATYFIAQLGPVLILLAYTQLGLGKLGRSLHSKAVREEEAKKKEAKKNKANKAAAGKKVE